MKFCKAFVFRTHLSCVDILSSSGLQALSLSVSASTPPSPKKTIKKMFWTCLFFCILQCQISLRWWLCSLVNFLNETSHRIQCLFGFIFCVFYVYSIDALSSFSGIMTPFAFLPSSYLGDMSFDLHNKTCLPHNLSVISRKWKINFSLYR